MLGPGGFQSARDILGITVNRWSHGYAYTPSTLYDDPDALAPRQKAVKKKIGRIAFASSDTAWNAYAHSAMSEALRAVDELTPKPTAKSKSKAGAKKQS
jgi:spermidine dehydrogenase